MDAAAVAKYTSVNTSSQPSRMMVGMSPRLASLNSGHDGDGPSGGTGENMINSSCKDTMKMNDQREFSFFESVNREFGNANAAQYPNHGSLG